MPTPKKPTNLHILNGNPSKIKDIGQGEPKPQPIAPKPPQWLCKNAKKIFKDLAPKMEKIGLLTEVDGLAFANLCQEQADLYRRQKLLNKEGDTVQYTNVKGATNVITRPEVLLVQKGRQIIKAYCAEFGLTPSSRGRMQVPGEKTPDDFEEFLNRGSK